MPDKRCDKDEFIALDEPCEMARFSEQSHRSLRQQGKTPCCMQDGKAPLLRERRRPGMARYRPDDPHGPAQASARAG